MWHVFPLFGVRVSALNHVQEGLPTIGLGVWIWYTLAPSPQEATFLTQAERDHVSRAVLKNKVCEIIVGTKRAQHRA